MKLGEFHSLASYANSPAVSLGPPPSFRSLSLSLPLSLCLCLSVSLPLSLSVSLPRSRSLLFFSFSLRRLSPPLYSARNCRYIHRRIFISRCLSRCARMILKTRMTARSWDHARILSTRKSNYSANEVDNAIKPFKTLVFAYNMQM